MINSSLSRLSSVVLAGSASGILFLAGCAKTEPAATVETAAAPAATTSATTFDTLERKVSYGIGHNIGLELARDPSITIEVAAFSAGLEDALNDSELRVSQEELQAAFQIITQKARDLVMEQTRANRAAAQEFLENNRSREGVVVTDSGLQYEVITMGDGPKPAATDRVRVHYHGTLIDGTVFDSSVERGAPTEFPLNQVIAGWTEGVQLMPVGSKWKFYVPPALAYGDQDRGKIKPGSALVFEVELLEIK